MKLRFVTLLVLFFIPFVPKAFCQDDCQSLILKYSNWKESPQTQWSLKIAGKNAGTLIYYGVKQHTNDPASQTIQDINSWWADAKPTIVFYEGPNRGIANTDTGTVRNMGESGYVRYLAGQAGVKIMSLEPPPAELYNYLCQEFTQEKADLYFMLNEAMRLRTRKGFNQEQVTAGVQSIITKMNALTGGHIAIKSVAELETAYKKYWPGAHQWWQAPQDWFDPNKKDGDTGGVFTNSINSASSDFRNIFMYRALAEQVNKGERVFAVVGRNHIAMQADALRCAVK